MTRSPGEEKLERVSLGDQKYICKGPEKGRMHLNVQGNKQRSNWRSPRCSLLWILLLKSFRQEWDRVVSVGSKRVNGVTSQEVLAVVQAQVKAAKEMEREECTDLRDIWGQRDRTCCTGFFHRSVHGSCAQWLNLSCFLLPVNKRDRAW